MLYHLKIDVYVSERLGYWCMLFKFSMSLCISVSMVSHKLSTHSTPTHPHITQNTHSFAYCPVMNRQMKAEGEKKICLSKCFISSFNVSVWKKETSIIL